MPTTSTPRRPGFKPTPPPPPPRDLSGQPRPRGGLWAVRLIILPHTLIALGLLVAMVIAPIWQMKGTVSTVPATRVFTRTSSKNRTSYCVEYVDPVSHERKEKSGIGYGEYQRLLHALSATNGTPVESAASTAPIPAGPTVTVTTLMVGPYAITDVLAPGSTGWSVVGFVWLFGFFWILITSLAVFGIYVKPVLDRRLRRDGDASPGRIVGKRTGRGSRGSKRHVVRYAFTPGAGRTMRRSSSSTAVAGEVTAETDVSAEEWERLQEGDEVWVLHWPGKGKPSALYGVGTAGLL